MAVEIPVVVDIDAAFSEAAKRVPAALKPVKDSLNGLSKDLAKFQADLNKYKIDSNQWKNAAKNFQAISEALEVANYRFLKFSTNEGSIKRMNADLAETERRWEAMGTKQKFDKNGNLTKEAKQLWDTYKKITEELVKEGKSLAQLEAEEKKVLELAKRRQELTAQGAKKRQYENAILNATVKTMRTLQEQERILSERLNRTVIGTDKYKQLQERLRAVQAEMRAVAGSSDAVTASFRRQTSVIGRLTATFASYVSVFTLLRFAKQIRDVTGEFEYQRVALGHLIQDEEYGARLFEQIKEKAVESPFRIKDLLTYTKQLASYRVEQEQLFSTMDRLADVSAGLGVDMNRLILAYGQVRSASVLRGQELRQFTEAGIPLVALLAEKFSELNGKAVKTADVFELISKRAVPFSMISEIFEDMTDTGGMFFRMQERQAETLRGRWEKLKDAFDVGLQSIGNTKSFEKYNNGLLKILNTLAKNLQLVPKIIEGMTAAWAAYSVSLAVVNLLHKKEISYEMRLAASQKVRATTIPRITTAVLTQARAEELLTKAFIKQEIAATGLQRAFWKLTAAMLTNPIGVVAAAASAIAVAFTVFKKKTDEVVSSFEDFDKIIEDTSTGLKNYAKYDKLISRYDRLASSTDRTVKETNRLYQTMTLLQELFPDVELGINAESEALDKQVEKLRQRNEEMENEIRLRAEGELGAKTVELSDAEKRREKLYKERFKLTQKAAEIEKNLQFNELYKDSPEWKSAKQRIGEINKSLLEQDKLIDGLRKRVERLYYILHPDTAKNPFNAWQRQIQSMRDITVGDVTSPIFTDDQIEKWETLDAALEDINKRKKEVRDREDQLSESIKNQTGEIKEQIQAELEWARAERLRLEAMEDFFKSPTIFGKDIIDNFSKLLLKTYDKGNIEQLGKAMLGYLTMQTNIKFNPELLARPMIDAAQLIEKGWENAGEGIATVFSSVYDWTDEFGEKHNIMMTPILPDGTVLSPDELDEYVKKVIASSDFNDEKHLVLGIDVTEDAGERLHEMQEEFYGLIEMSENLPEDFLITDKEIAGLKTATDVLELVEEKITAIEKEIDRVDELKLEPNIGEDVINAAEQYERHLQSIYEWLIALQGRYTDPLSGLAKEVQGMFPNLMESMFKGTDKETFAKMGLFSDADLKKITTVVDLYSLWATKIQAVTKEIENYSKKLSSSISPEQRNKILSTIESLSEEKKELEGMGDVFGFLLKQGGRSGSYEQDPWILLYKNRMKFMQDFRQGVEDLDKYLAHPTSLGKEQEIMKGRGLSLGIDVNKLKGDADDLRDWYKKTIDEIVAKINSMGGKEFAGLGVTEILAKDLTGRKIQKYQELLQEVWKGLTDFDTNEMKKQIDEKIKELTEKIKRSEAAQNFFQSILGLTGDQQLAASLSMEVYGTPGDDLKKRIQDELKGTFDALEYDEKSKLPDAVKNAVEAGDVNALLNMEDLPAKLEQAARKGAEAIEKYNAGIASDYAKLLMRYNELEQERVNVTNQAAKDIKTIEEGLALEIEGIRKNEQIKDKEAAEQKARDRAAAAKAAVEAETELQLSRLERDYRMFFSSVGVISEESARRVAANQKRMLTQQFEQGQISLSKYKRELKEVAAQMKKYEEEQNIVFSYLSGGVQGVADKFSQIGDNFRAISHNLRTEGGTSGMLAMDEETMAYVDKIGKLMGGSIFGVEGVSGRKNVADQLVTAIASISKDADDFKKNLMTAMDTAAEGADSFASNFSAGVAVAGFWVKNVSTLIKELDTFNQDALETPKWLDALASTVTWTLGVGGDEAWDRLANLNEYATSGFEKFSQGNFVGALIDNIKGLIDFWGPNIKKINRQIKEQDELVDDLDYQYRRLENAIQKAFGSDYIKNYNQQLDNLYAKQEAYLKQAELEQSKGKKKDPEKIKEYENNARDVSDQIEDMKSQLSEFFAGTDLTSAAKDFATAWIDAYKEFGSVTSAMKEKFQDMIQAMVENSLAAQIMQKLLDPIFAEIDRLAQESGELSAADIAAISNLAAEKIPEINDAMMTLMNTLSAAGVSMTAQPGNLTGISRNIAGASEESIVGLAAGINTQNYYMSYMPTISANVAAILMHLTGGTAETTGATPITPTNGELMMGYMSNMDANLAELLYVVRSVVSPKSAATNTHYVAVRQ